MLGCLLQSPVQGRLHAPAEVRQVSAVYAAKEADNVRDEIGRFPVARVERSGRVDMQRLAACGIGLIGRDLSNGDHSVQDIVTSMQGRGKVVRRVKRGGSLR